MNELSGLKQDEQMEELLDLLENMQKEADQNHRIIQQKEVEIGQLQMQLQESLNLCEKLNRENKAENIQALKNDLIQTRELLQSEKEDRKKADNMIKECRGRLRQAEKEKEYALTHQRKVEIPVEKPVLYEKCKICNCVAYQQAKVEYENKRDKLDRQYITRLTAHKICFYGFIQYSLLITIFMAIRSKVFINDFRVFLIKIWEAICYVFNCLVMAGEYVAKLSDKMPNGIAAIAVHWFFFLLVIGGGIVAIGWTIFIGMSKLKKVYQENCGDMISIMFAVVSLATVVYFGDWLKDILSLNFVLVLVWVQVLYIGIRWYVKGCKKARGHY